MFQKMQEIKDGILSPRKITTLSQSITAEDLFETKKILNGSRYLLLSMLTKFVILSIKIIASESLALLNTDFSFFLKKKKTSLILS